MALWASGTFIGEQDYSHRWSNGDKLVSCDNPMLIQSEYSDPNRGGNDEYAIMLNCNKYDYLPTLAKYKAEPEGGWPDYKWVDHTHSFEFEGKIWFYTGEKADTTRFWGDDA